MTSKPVWPVGASTGRVPIVRSWRKADYEIGAGLPKRRVDGTGWPLPVCQLLVKDTAKRDIALSCGDDKARHSPMALPLDLAFI